MRLEDWQKWLDSQFVGDEEDLTPPPQNREFSTPDYGQGYRNSQEPPVIPPFSTPYAPPAQETMRYEPPASSPSTPVINTSPAPIPPVNTPQYPPGYTPPPPIPSRYQPPIPNLTDNIYSQNYLPPSSLKKDALPDVQHYEPPKTVPAPASPLPDAEVPTLERYLPYLTKKEGETTPETVPPVEQITDKTTSESLMKAPVQETIEAPAITDVVEEKVSAPAEEPAKETVIKAKAEPSVTPPSPPKVEVTPQVIQSKPDPTTAEVLEQKPPTPEQDVAKVFRSYTQSAMAETPPPPPKKPVEEEAQPKQRYGISHRRARHARNIAPTEIVDEMNPDMLWNLVPKHIQTLVTLGTQGEVAQNSYKKKFRETRLDMVQRLLDPALTLEDTARLLNVCPTTVRRYTNKGILTHQRTEGDQRRFKLSDVLAFLEAQSHHRE